jgi:glycylpeptide N-tetradecanoyltransferase
MADHNSSSSSVDQNQSPTSNHENTRSFWKTQPVSQFKDIIDKDLSEGPIKQQTPSSEIKKEPYNLPNAYEWITCDINSVEVYTEVYSLLTNHYCELDEKRYRLNYSKDFLNWTLCPPGYYKNWHVGVRVKTSKKMVAFIAGIPSRIRVNENVMDMAKVSMLCVHKKLRSKRLAPVMIKELTRRVQLENIWQGVYTANEFLYTPVATCFYWHRFLDVKKLTDTGIVKLGDVTTMNQAVSVFELPNSTLTPGFRKMVPLDAPAVNRLLSNYLKKFDVSAVFDDESIKHWLLPKENVVDSYVVESVKSGEITDFCSFYTVQSFTVGNPNHSNMKGAFCYYNVATETPLVQLMTDALIMAKQKNHDIFSALDVMQTQSFFKELMFKQGNELVNFYLFNYRLKNSLLPSNIGLVLP